MCLSGCDLEGKSILSYQKEKWGGRGTELWEEVAAASPKKKEIP